MSNTNNELKLLVEGLPLGMKCFELKCMFENTRRQGGGRVSCVDINEDSRSAIITFIEKSAVQTVLQRGCFVKIRDIDCKVLPVDCHENSTPNSRINEPEGPANEEQFESVSKIRVQSTIRLNVQDVKHKDVYTLFLGEDELYNEDMMFVDGLKKAVFVCFNSSEPAKRMCENCQSNDDVDSIDMADDEIYDHYDHMLSIHGANFNEIAEARLRQFARDKTNVSLLSVLQQDEPHSAILLFDKGMSRTDLYSLGWRCNTVFDGHVLVTAPVKRSKTVHVTYMQDNVNCAWVVKHFASFKRSGGGSVINSSKREDGSLLITFENPDVAQRVVRPQEVADIKLKVTIWHECLTREAYEDYLSLYRSAVPRTSFIVPKDSVEETVKLEHFEYEFLQKVDFITKTFGNLVDIVIQPNEGECAFTIKGSKVLVNDVINKINERVMNTGKAILNEFSDQTRLFLCQPKVLKKINSVLTEALLFPFNDKICCFPGVEEKLVVKQIDGMIDSETVDCGENVFSLAMQEGKQFILGLEADSEKPCKIETNFERQEVEVLAFKEHLQCLARQILKFTKNNKVVTEDILIPEIVLSYAKTQCKDVWDPVVQELQAEGAELNIGTDIVSIKGLQRARDKAQKNISSIRKSIGMQDIVLDGFGMKEYLRSDCGKSLLVEIGNKWLCMFTISGSNSNSNGGTLMGDCQLDNLTVKFVQGDITALGADVIVNPIDNTLKLQKCMGGFLIENGGSEIQEELNIYQGPVPKGTVIETRGGRLPCKNIYHLILEKKGEANDILTFVTNFLKKAIQDGHKSVAMPLLGCGRKHQMPQLGVIINMATAVKQHAKEANSLKEVIICDLSPDPISNILRRFETANTHATLHKSDANKFGNVNLTMKQNDILKEKCDVIACGIKENMQLLHAGAVGKSMLNMCGDPLQGDCDKKADELSQNGATIIPSHGLPCKAIIFVNMTKYSNDWQSGIEKVLSVAKENGHTSIALPAFGTGAKRANIQQLKSCTLQAIRNFGKSEGQNNLTDVRLVFFDPNILQTYQSDHTSDTTARKTARASAVPDISRKVELQVAFNDSKFGMNAVKELEQACKKNFISRSDKFKRIKDMSDQQISQLVAEGLKLGVEVSIDKSTQVVNLSSFRQKQITDMVKTTSDFIHRIAAGKDLAKIDSRYKWQFMGKKATTWRDFEERDSKNIEIAYQDKLDSCLITDNRGRKYKIAFQDMKEYKIDRNGELAEIAVVNRHDCTATGKKLPSSWSKMGEGENLKIVPLSSSSKEYTDTEAYFKQCGATVGVKKIERIQNVVLYEQYSAKLEYFQTANPKGHQNEKRLFHGTDPNAISNINESGFNRSFCGKNATAYGNGVYFAEQSSYSVSYAKADQAGNKMMYLARVLVGESTPSKSGMSFLPNKPNKNVPYDSGKGPNMYIIFHDCQAYPEYLITF